MANMCSLIFEIQCPTEQDRTQLYQKLEDRIAECNKQDVGLFLGAEERYLFYAHIEEKGDRSICMTSSVKWALEHDEAISMIECLLDMAPIDYAEIRYEELGCGLYGRYVYDGKMLTDIYIPPEQCPNSIDFDDLDELYGILEEMFDNDSLEYVVKDYENEALVTN